MPVRAAAAGWRAREATRSGRSGVAPHPRTHRPVLHSRSPPREVLVDPEQRTRTTNLLLFFLTLASAALAAEESGPSSGFGPEEAAQRMTLPPGFKATLFAGEPDVVQPIAFAIDDRGRLWVAEAYTYPNRAKDGEGRDRILVFEDIDGDGRFNKRTVFLDKLNLVSGIEVGFGKR